MAMSEDSSAGVGVMLNPDVLTGSVFLVFKKSFEGGYNGIMAMLGFKNQEAAVNAFVAVEGEDPVGFVTKVTMEDYRALVSIRAGEDRYASPLMQSLSKFCTKRGTVVGLKKGSYAEVEEAEPLQEGQDLTWMGMDLHVECPPGQARSGVSKTGVKWTMYVEHYYGYFPDSVSMEAGEELDFILEKERMPSEFVYVFDMTNDGNLGVNEEKVFLGFASDGQARQAFLSMYGEDKLGIMYAMTTADFLEYLDMRAPEAIHKDGEAVAGEEQTEELIEDPLDAKERKSLTRKMLRSFREVTNLGAAVGKETIRGSIATLRFSLPQEGAGAVVGSPFAKGRILVELYGTGGTVGSVACFGETPTEALKKGLEQVALLKAQGLWNTEKHQIRTRETGLQINSKTEVWRDAVLPFMLPGAIARCEISKSLSEEAAALKRQALEEKQAALRVEESLRGIQDGQSKVVKSVEAMTATLRLPVTPVMENGKIVGAVRKEAPLEGAT